MLACKCALYGRLVFFKVLFGGDVSLLIEKHRLESFQAESVYKYK